jgi:hypothetical protein
MYAVTAKLRAELMGKRKGSLPTELASKVRLTRHG